MATGPALSHKSAGLTVRLCHVVTFDGQFADAKGSSQGVSNAADLARFLAERSRVDVAITGGRTARLENLRSTSRCALCILTNDPDSLSIPALSLATENLVFLATTNPLISESLPHNSSARVIELDSAGNSTYQLLAALEALGFQTALLEGGPELIRMFANSGSIATVSLTVTGLNRKISREEARAIVATVSYLPATNESLKIDFDSSNNYLEWTLGGVAVGQ